MLCKNVQVLFNDYIDGNISEEDVSRVDNHCETCESCSAQLDAFRSIQGSLLALPVPTMPVGFEKRVVKAAIADAQTTSSGYSSYNGLYKFAAAAMISAVVIFLGVFNDERSEETPYQLAVGNDVRTIKVAIDSDQELEAVEMRVELSENLELKGFGSKKQIHWTTNLREGVNVIELPIIGIAQGQGDITTRVHLNGKEKVMHIKTQFKIPGSVLFVDDTVLQG